MLRVLEREEGSQAGGNGRDRDSAAGFFYRQCYTHDLAHAQGPIEIRLHFLRSRLLP